MHNADHIRRAEPPCPKQSPNGSGKTEWLRPSGVIQKQEILSHRMMERKKETKGQKTLVRNHSIIY
jgi:hypothetical protein